MTNYIQNDDVSRVMSPLAEFLLSDQGDHEHEERYFTDYDMSTESLEKHIRRRDGSNKHYEHVDVFSHSFVVQQSMARYFQIIEDELVTLDGVFSVKEITIIANMNPTKYWNINQQKTLLSMLLIDQRIGSKRDLEARGDLNILIGKLKKLTAAQNMALTDVCERFWRNISSGDSLFEIFSNLGLQLKMELH